MFDPTHQRRQSHRYLSMLAATCRTAMGRKLDLVLSNISTDGCAVTTKTDALKPGQLVVVRTSTLEGLPGMVCWVRGNMAGVRFERPLYGPVVEHLVRSQPPSPPPSMRRSTRTTARW
jgi:hypothetical protein